MKFIELSYRQSSHVVNLDHVMWFADRVVALATGGTLVVDQNKDQISLLIEKAADNCVLRLPQDD